MSKLPRLPRNEAVVMEEVNRSGGSSGACHAQMYTMGALLRHGRPVAEEDRGYQQVPSFHRMADGKASECGCRRAREQPVREGDILQGTPKARLEAGRRHRGPWVLRSGLYQVVPPQQRVASRVKAAATSA